MANRNVYDVGDLVQSWVYFTNAAGARVDPTTVTVKYRNGSEAAVTKEYGTDVEVVKDGVGAYHIDISPGAAGTWHIRWAGTGAAQAAFEESFTVRATEF